MMRSVRFSANGDELLTLADCTLNLGETLWLDHRKPATGEVTKAHKS